MSILMRKLLGRLLILGLCLTGLALLAAECQETRPPATEPTATPTTDGSGDSTTSATDDDTGLEQPVVEGSHEVAGDAPGPVYLEYWPALFEREAFDELIAETEAVIAQGEGAGFYAEAQLFRGLAELGKEGDTKVAQTHLKIADENSAQFTTATQKLLLTGKTILEAKLGETAEFELHGNQILKQLETSPQGEMLELQDFQTRPGLIINEQIQQQLQNQELLAPQR